MKYSLIYIVFALFGSVVFVQADLFGDPLNGLPNTLDSVGKNVATVGNTANNALGTVGNTGNGAFNTVGNTANNAVDTAGNTTGRTLVDDNKRNLTNSTSNSTLADNNKSNLSNATMNATKNGTVTDDSTSLTGVNVTKATNKPNASAATSGKRRFRF